MGEALGVSWAYAIAFMVSKHASVVVYLITIFSTFSVFYKHR